jgi:hypothetical protein
MRKMLFAFALLFVSVLVAWKLGWPPAASKPYWLSDGRTLELFCYGGTESGTLVVSTKDSGVTAHIQFNDREALLRYRPDGFSRDRYGNDTVEMTLDPEAKVSGLTDEYLSCAI